MKKLILLVLLIGLLGCAEDKDYYLPLPEEDVIVEPSAVTFGTVDAARPRRLSSSMSNSGRRTEGTVAHTSGSPC